MKPRQSLEGKRFSRLTVIRVAGRIKYGLIWECVCDCGKTTKAITASLNRGAVKSCGCLRLEGNGHLLKTHGKSGIPEHGIWKALIRRCYNKNTKDYPRYGGVGISVCDRWRNSFSEFLKDMGERPSSNHSIDRIDNGGNYEPSNCRWATIHTQANNKSNNLRISINGETKTLADWVCGSGLSYAVVHARIRRGWNPSVALTTSDSKPQK